MKKSAEQSGSGSGMLRKGMFILSASLVLTTNIVKAEVMKIVGKDKKLEDKVLVIGAPTQVSADNTIDFPVEQLAPREVQGVLEEEGVSDDNGEDEKLDGDPPLKGSESVTEDDHTIQYVFVPAEQNYSGLTEANREAILTPQVHFIIPVFTKHAAEDVETEYGGWTERCEEFPTKGAERTMAMYTNSGADVQICIVPDTLNVPENIIPDPEGGTLEEVQEAMNAQMANPESYMYQEFDKIADTFNIPREQLYYVLYARNSSNGAGALTNYGEKGFIMMGDQSFRYLTTVYQPYADEKEGSPNIYTHEMVKDILRVCDPSGTTVPNIKGSDYEPTANQDFRFDEGYIKQITSVATPSAMVNTSTRTIPVVSQAGRRVLITNLDTGLEEEVPLDVDDDSDPTNDPDAFHHIEWEEKFNEYYTPRGVSVNDTLFSEHDYEGFVDVLLNDDPDMQRLEFYGPPNLPAGVTVGIDRGSGPDGRDQFYVVIDEQEENDNFEFSYVAYSADGGKMIQPTKFVYKRDTTTSVQDPEMISEDLLVYPNPTNGAVTLDGIKNPKYEAVRIRCFNQTGQLVEDRIMGNESGPYSIDLQEQAPGIYFTKVFVGNKCVGVKKIVRQ
jgi:hypothetical protein